MLVNSTDAGDTEGGIAMKLSSRPSRHLAVHTTSAILRAGQQAPLLGCPFLLKYRALSLSVGVCVRVCWSLLSDGYLYTYRQDNHTVINQVILF